MTIHELMCEDGDQKFTVGRSKVVWDGCYMTSKGNIRIHRIVDFYSKGIFIGHEYYSRGIDPETIIKKRLGS